MKVGKRYALINVSVVDGNGGKPVDNQAVIINNGYIEKVCPADEVNDDSLEKISLPGKYVMPGLIDSHVHLAGITDLKYWGQIEYSAAMTHSYTQALRMLKYGFTSVRDISENGTYLKRAFNMPGVVGPRIIACGRGLTRTGGHAEVTLYSDLEYEEANNKMKQILRAKTAIIFPMGFFSLYIFNNLANRHLILKNSPQIEYFINLT